MTIEAAPQAEAEAERLFIERMDEWRRAMGCSHKAFASRLGLSRAYWYALRARRTELTIGVAARVLTERPELDLILGGAPRYFWERRWRLRRARQRRAGGARLDAPTRHPGDAQEGTPPRGQPEGDDA